MKKYSKKILSIIVLTILTLSFAMPLISVSATTVASVPEAGQVGDVLTITGTASSASGATVSAYWDTVVGGSVLNTTSVGSDQTYEMEISIPATTAGNHRIWVDDTTNVAMSDEITVSSEIDLNIDSGIPGDDLIVTATGFFDDQDDVNTTFHNATYSNPIVNNSETDANGGVSITFDVPDVAYGVYTVNVTDGNNTSTHSFTIGAAITLTEDEGPEGYEVTITGRGFTADVEINETAVDGYVAWNSAVALAANIMNITDDDFTIDDDGEFTGTVVIPSAGEGDYNISVTDGTYTAYAEFTIGNGGESTITVSPTHGVPGTTVTVTGVNFTQIEGSDITVTLATSSVTVDVEADGTFTATLTVPSAVFTTYTVTAQDLVFGTIDTDSYKIGLMSMTLGTSSGDVGSGVIVSAVGFEANGKYNVTMGDTLVIHNGSIDANEFLSDTFYVPSMAAGSYTVTVTDATNSMSTSYEVTEDTSLSGSPTEVAIGQNLTLTGEGFLETDATAVTVMWANSTDSADVTGDAYTADTAVALTTEAYGNFSGHWIVPATLIVGNTYTLNASTANPDVGEDITDYQLASFDFTIVEESIEVAPTATSFHRGDTVTFTIKTTFAKASADLNLTDPNGDVFVVDELQAGEWTTSGDWKTVHVNTQDFGVLPSYAPLGTWTWVLAENNEGDGIASGTFAVVESLDEKIDNALVGINTKLDGHDTDLTALNTDVAAVKTDVAAVKTDVASVSADVAGVSADVAGVKTDVAEVQTGLADDIATVQSYLAGDIDAVESSLGKDINAVKASLASDIDSAKANLAYDIDAVKEDLAYDIDTLSSDLTWKIGNVKTDVENLNAEIVEDLTDDIATATSAANAAGAAVDGLSSTLGDLQSSVSDIADVADNAESAANAAATAASDAASAAENANTATSGLTSLVYGAIGASLIAALAAIVSLMQISKRIAG